MIAVILGTSCWSPEDSAILYSVLEVIVMKNRKSTAFKVPLLLIPLSFILLIFFCLTSATAYAIDATDDYEENENVIDETHDGFRNAAHIVIEDESQETTNPVLVDKDHLIPEDPPVGEGESPSKIIVPELQDKTGVPEVYDDGIFRYYLVDGAYYEVAGIYKSCFAEIVIPSELFGVPVRGIQSNAFRQYKYLVSVVIPDSIEYIGDYAFHNCPNLTSVSLPRNEIKIGEGVFQFFE